MADDYQRISQAIHYIRQHHKSQPSLTQIANAVHLSEYHFQRLFSRWAGISPKRYLQVLTLEQAKLQLKNNSASTLDVSFKLGLSSSSRLHDHFVTLEAITPAEFKNQGSELTIEYGFHNSPFGQIFIAITSRGICQLDFVENHQQTAALDKLKNNWPLAACIQNQTKTEIIAQQVFNNSAQKATPISLLVKGTNFQINVWRALLQLGSGQVASYKDIANIIGKPRASRAIGTAIGANPIAFIIPCHRVLRQNGELGGYRWGETRKHLILAKEAANSEP